MDEHTETRYAAAVRTMARWRLEAREHTAGLPPIVDPAAWLAKTEASIWGEHVNEIEHLNLDQYTGETLAWRLAHGQPRQPARPGWVAQRPWPPCARCSDTGWVDAGRDARRYEFVARCDCEKGARS